ncbi:MAG: hypothetical protein ACRDTF_08385 [Pseudonocardiaceae bacterium]
MQLGVSLEDIIERVAAGEVDILGVSVTFGQHDLMTRLLDEITSSDPDTLVVAGGSLTARNERILLARYPVSSSVGARASPPSRTCSLPASAVTTNVHRVGGMPHRAGQRGRGERGYDHVEGVAGRDDPDPAAGDLLATDAAMSYRPIRRTYLVNALGRRTSNGFPQ